MDNKKKLKPDIAPGVVNKLADSLKKAIDNSGEREQISIKHRISGGIPSQAYYFNFSVNGLKNAECEIKNSMVKNLSKTRKTVLKNDDIKGLLKVIQKTGILNLPREPVSFLPDTLVGYIEIISGESVFRYYYIADEEQAKTQNKIPPAAVRTTADYILKLGSKLLDIKKIKP